MNAVAPVVCHYDQTTPGGNEENLTSRENR